VLENIGYGPEVATAFAPWASATDARPGRVARVDGGVASVLTEHGLRRIGLAGGLLGEVAMHPASRPCPGDWVVVREWCDHRLTLEAVLPRRTTVTWPVPASTAGEVLCANADVVAVVLDDRARPAERRRLLALAHGSGARTQVVTPDDTPETLHGLVDGHLTLALVGTAGHHRLTDLLVGADVIGSSEGGRGLVVLPGGGAVIDTPDVRRLRPARGPHLPEVR
jgi:ribosome biogenesis GTPase